MISINDQTAIPAAVNAYGQRHPAFLTTARTSRRCPVGIHNFDLPTSLFRFVNHDGYELRPTGIMNTFRQMMVLDHPIDIQILELDDTIFFSKLVRLFEMMISTLSSYVLMLSRHQLSGVRFFAALSSVLALLDDDTEDSGFDRHSTDGQKS